MKGAVERQEEVHPVISERSLKLDAKVEVRPSSAASARTGPRTRDRSRRSSRRSPRAARPRSAREPSTPRSETGRPSPLPSLEKNLGEPLAAEDADGGWSGALPSRSRLKCLSRSSSSEPFVIGDARSRFSTSPAQRVALFSKRSAASSIGAIVSGLDRRAPLVGIWVPAGARRPLGGRGERESDGGTDGGTPRQARPFLRPLTGLSKPLPLAERPRKGPYGIRTRAAAVRGRCPRPLDEWAGSGRVAHRPFAARAHGTAAQVVSGSRVSRRSSNSRRMDSPLASTAS
jgi:hypothetical protein